MLENDQNWPFLSALRNILITSNPGRLLHFFSYYMEDNICKIQQYRVSTTSAKWCLLIVNYILEKLCQKTKNNVKNNLKIFITHGQNPIVKRETFDEQCTNKKMHYWRNIEDDCGQFPMTNRVNFYWSI